MISARPTRVLVLDANANTPPYDRALCRALVAAGCNIELATSRFLYEALPSPDGYRLRHAFFRLTTSHFGGEWVAERPAARRLLKAAEYPLDWAILLAALERQRPDVVHIQWSPSPELDRAFWRWLRWRGVPVVYTAHNLLPHAARVCDHERYRRLYHAADAIIVHSHRSAAELVDRFGLPVQRVAAAPHGPLLEDERELSRDEARRRLGLPLDARLVLFIGLIEAYKGLADLIDAFARFAPAQPGTWLVVAGRPNEPFGPHRQALESFGLLGRVHLDLRYLPRAELAAYLCSADVVALPYRQTTTSGTLMAAWRFGRAVVATATGDLPEIVADGESGLLVSPAEPRALADALSRVLADPSLELRLGEAGRERTLTDLSWTEAARRTLEVYRAVLG